MEPGPSRVDLPSLAAGVAGVLLVLAGVYVLVLSIGDWMRMALGLLALVAGALILYWATRRRPRPR